jgi:NADH-quinone oxidoreductase subunit M
LIGFFYHQTHNRFVPDLSGLARKIPFIGVCMVMAVMASSGLPGFANFVSEVMVFIGAWSQGSTVFRIATICAVWGIVVTATYLLRAVRASFFGPLDEQWNMLKDATTWKQKFPYAFLIAVLLVVGFWPRALTDIIKPSVAQQVLATNSHESPRMTATTETLRFAQGDKPGSGEQP